MARLERVAMSASSSVASRRVAVLCDTCRASAISWGGVKAGVPVIHLMARDTLFALPCYAVEHEQIRGCLN